jgi:flagellar hook assembly protein FlgD
MVTGGAMGADGALANTKDSKEAQTAAKFGDVLSKIQGQFGAKADKPREIKKQLGKDDFLRIMITQMKHQDPTSPFKPEQMAAEMAQFTSVEQLQNVNQNLAKMANQNQPLERLAMTGLIGKTVTIDKERFAHLEGQNEALSFALPKEAKEVHLTILSEAGEVMLEKDLGPQKAGENAFNWDGLRSNTLPAKNGNYLIRVDAKDEKGARVQSGGIGQARVIGLSFEGSEPVFLVGDHQRQAKVTMKNIVRIEDGSLATPGAPQAGGLPGSAPIPGQPGSGPGSMITFKKGEGSSTSDAATASPEIAEALARAAQSAATSAASAPVSAAPAPATKSASNDNGFPNGLHDDETAGSAVSPKQKNAGKI